MPRPLLPWLPPMPQDGFLSLLETHDHLDELFLLHQEALIMMNFELASELLAAYRKLLAIHIEQEELELLPLFERAGAVPRAPVVLFTGQHRKLTSHLDKIALGLAEASQSEEPRRLVIALLELETAFKHLNEHHDGAEVEYFYPTLEKMATSAEHADVVSRCWNQWNSARTEVLKLVSRAQQTLEVTTRA